MDSLGVPPRTALCLIYARRVSRQASSRYAHIDAMRAAAVMVVVVAHAGVGHIIPGGSGVTIFFVISGFIITHLLLKERDATGRFDVGGFYFRRAAKILPPLIALILIPTLIYGARANVNWEQVLSQVFFVFNFYYASGEVNVLPGSAVVWSLAVEEQFYIIFALIWLTVIRRARWELTVTATAVIVLAYSTIARLVLASDVDNERRISFGTDTRLDAIAVGVLLALLLRRSSAGNSPALLPRSLSTNLALAVAVALYLGSLVIRDDWFRMTFRYTLQAIAAAIVIAYGMLPGRGGGRAFFERVVRLGPIATVGRASYSIYLAHAPVYAFTAPWLGDMPLAAKLPLLVSIGTGVGVAAYYLIEVPVENWRRARRHGHAKLTPEPAGMQGTTTD